MPRYMRRAKLIGRAPRDDLARADPTQRDGTGLRYFGTTGSKRHAYEVQADEWDPRLQGQAAAKRYIRMVDNSAGLGGAVLLIQSLLSQVEFNWEVPEDVADEDRVQAEEYRDFVEGAWNDIESSHQDVLTEMFSCVVHGYSLTETIYKLRRGPDADPMLRSKFADGKVGWRDFEPRSADSVTEWVWRENKVVGFWQRVEGDTGDMYVPLSKCIHVRLGGTGRRNPEGRSLLRSAVRSSTYREGVEEYEATGVERQLHGFPVLRVPQRILTQGATPAEKAEREALAGLLKNYREGRSNGALFPARALPNGNVTGYDFEIVATGVDPSKADPIIRRYATAELTALLSEVIALGTGSVGSWALASSKTSTLALVLGAILRRVTEAFSSQEVPRLFRMNGFPVHLAPRLVPGDIETMPLDELGGFLTSLASIGALTPDAKLEEYLRKLAGLPPIEHGEAGTPALGPHSAEEEAARAEEDKALEEETYATQAQLDGSLSLADAAARLHTSSSTLAKLIRGGSIPGLRVPRGWRVHPRDLEAYLTGLQGPRGSVDGSDAPGDNTA